METTYVYKASKLNDFLGLLACGAAALSISISIAYGDRHEEASDVKKSIESAKVVLPVTIAAV